MATSLKTGNARFYDGEGNRLFKQTIPFLWNNMRFYVTVKYGSWKYMNFHRHLFAKFSQFIFSTILLEPHTIKLDRSTNITILHANFIFVFHLDLPPLQQNAECYFRRHFRPDFP